MPEGRLFFHDMGCDGFVRNDSIDIFYEGSTAQTLLDGDWAAQSLTETSRVDGGTSSAAAGAASASPVDANPAATPASSVRHRPM